MDLQQGSIMFSLVYTASYVVFMMVLMYNFGSGFVGAGLSLQLDVLQCISRIWLGLTKCSWCTDASAATGIAGWSVNLLVSFGGS